MLKVVKIGGNIVDNPGKLKAFLADFAAIEGAKILVHGGGKVATAIAAALGIETVMIDGRRVTDARTLEVVTMVYSGINKQIVSVLQGLGCDAVGMCGADGRLVVSKKRGPVVVNGRTVDYGFVGDPVGVNTALVKQLVDEGFTLVVAPITYDGGGDGACAGGGGLLNTNADTVAQAIAVAMAGGDLGAGADPIVSSGVKKMGTNWNAEVELVYCFEKQGVMADVDDEGSVMERIDRARFDRLKAEGAVHSGMLPKLENAFRALDRGVEKVVICAAENIARPGCGGTTIVR